MVVQHGVPHDLRTAGGSHRLADDAGRPTVLRLIRLCRAAGCVDLMHANGAQSWATEGWCNAVFSRPRDCIACHAPKRRPGSVKAIKAC